MSRFHTMSWLPRLAILAGAAWLPTPLLASDRVKGASQRIDPESETVDLFAGIQQGQLEAKLIVADSSKCRVMLKNLTDRPLNVQLPAAFAGVPVLAQFGNRGMNQGIFGNDNMLNNNNAPQQVGVGFPQNNWMNNNGNNNMFNLRNNPGMNNGRQNPVFGPLFNIAPEKVGKFKLECVCLDHGNPSPRPRIAYQIKPIESVAKKAEVAVVCAMLGRGQLSQKAAQAAAWHFHNGLTWEQLRREQKSFAMGRIHEPYFTGRQLAAAKKAAQRAEQIVQDSKKASPSDSLSQK
jgi:hypothetical protein